MITTHGGDIYRNRVTLDFSVNLNPLGMPEGVRRALCSGIDRFSAYPDTECAALRAGLSARLGVPAEQILCGNGAAALLYDLLRVLRPKEALVAVPTFTEYEAALRAAGCETRRFLLREADGFRPDLSALAEAVKARTDLVFLCNPNNPNGLAVPREEVLYLEKICREKGARLLVDECFAELLMEPERYSVLAHSAANCLREYPDLLILRAFTKSFALAGLRLGYLVCGDAALLNALCAARQPWSVSVPAQIAGEAALSETEYLENARRVIAAGRAQLGAGLAASGFTVYPSDANFLLFSAGQPDLKERLLARGILIRACADYAGLPADKNFYRICVRTPEENDRFLSTLREDESGLVTRPPIC